MTLASQEATEHGQKVKWRQLRALLRLLAPFLTCCFCTLVLLLLLLIQFALIFLRLLAANMHYYFILSLSLALLSAPLPCFALPLSIYILIVSYVFVYIFNWISISPLYIVQFAGNCQGAHCHLLHSTTTTLGTTTLLLVIYFDIVDGCPLYSEGPFAVQSACSLSLSLSFTVSLPVK